MERISQTEKAKIFLELHHSGELLILPNIWDPIGARILESIEYPACATASAAVSASLGLKDAETISLSTHLEIVKRIAESVNIPVTADMERGYAETTKELEAVTGHILETGVVGINIEDSISEGEALRDINEQVERISAVREISEKAGIHLVINARTDVFLLKNDMTEKQRISSAIERAEAYQKAGADCIYPVSAHHKETLIELRKNISLPINIIAAPGALQLKELKELGINRVSLGPYVFRSLYKKFENIAKQLLSMGNYDCVTNEIFTYNEVSAFLNQRD